MLKRMLSERLIVSLCNHMLLLKLYLLMMVQGINLDYSAVGCSTLIIGLL